MSQPLYALYTWRSTRQTGLEFLKQQAANGVPNSAIFSAPGVKVEHVAIDWLHTADIGITECVFGNAMFECLQLLQGTTLNSMAVALWQRLKLNYKEARPPAQFQKLTLDAIRMPGKGPDFAGKLRKPDFWCLLCCNSQPSLLQDRSTLH